MFILKYFGIESPEASASSSETQTVRQITAALDRMEPEQARYVAGFAYILSRVARADLKISEAETRAMEKIVAEHGGLSEAQAVIAVQIAKSQNLLFGGTENFLVTREFSKLASRDRKLALLDCLFAVAAAEAQISAKEDNEIRQISNELGLDHRDFIAVRSGHRDHLAFLNKPSA
jgi:uncharacterized tellurite resistance protein B-like protein